MASDGDTVGGGICVRWKIEIPPGTAVFIAAGGVRPQAVQQVADQ